MNYNGRISCVNSSGVGNGEMNLNASKFMFYAPLFMNVDGTMLQVITLDDMQRHAEPSQVQCLQIDHR